MNGTTHSIRSISSSVILLLAISAHAATVWDGPMISFTKANYANPLLAENQDRLTANVWITRGSAQGLFNAKTESGFTHYVSPAGTEWANGSLENYATLSYTDWNHWAKGVNPGPRATVGVQAVLHLIPDDIYLSVRFTSWTGGDVELGLSFGGGFSYLRSTPVPEPTNAVPIVTWQQPANNAAFPPGFVISLRARATDSDGTVSNVDFFATPPTGPAINVGQGTLASDGYYIREWTNPPPGQYQLHAEAVDNAGGRGISDSVQIVVVDTSQPPTNAQTRTWTGADPSGYWSAPANWSPAGVLVNGDALVFPGGLPPGDKVSTNDLTDRVFLSISFTQAGGHTIRGNPITLTNRTECIVNSGTNVIACDLIFSGTPSTPQFTSIRGLGGELTVLGNVGGGSLYVFNGRLVIRGQFTGGRLRQYGGALALYGDNPYAVSAEAQNGPRGFLVQGSQPNLDITLLWEMESAACASLSGTGVVGNVTGCGHIILDSTLSVKNLSLSLSSYTSFLEIYLYGTNVGEYGRLVSSGEVNLSNGFLFPSAGFHPQAGQVFTIVEKTSPGAITNAPFGPEGSFTTLNGMPFRISYVGGDGNEVTLTATPPRLDVARTSDPPQVRLSWPTNYPAFQLQRASAIDGSAPWSNHPMSPVVMGSNYTVTTPAAANHEFFRLKQ